MENFVSKGVHFEKTAQGQKTFEQIQTKNIVTDKPITLRNQYQTKTEYVEEGKDF